MSGQDTTASTGEDDQAGFPIAYYDEAENGRDVSTTGPSILVSRRSDDGKRLQGRVVIRTELNISTADNPTKGVRIRLDRSERSREPKKRKVLRRFQGIFLGDDGTQARVMLFHKGERFDYTIPLRSLHAAGVKHLNQPFEMDEFEHVDGNSATFGYVFKALAGSHTAFTDVVGLSPELKAKQRAVFQKFGKSSD